GVDGGHEGGGEVDEEVVALEAVGHAGKVRQHLFVDLTEPLGLVVEHDLVGDQDHISCGGTRGTLAAEAGGEVTRQERGDGDFDVRVGLVERFDGGNVHVIVRCCVENYLA